MKSIELSFLLLGLFIFSAVAVVADEIEVGDSIKVTPDGIFGDDVEVTREGVKVGNVKVKKDGDPNQEAEATEAGKVYRGGDFTGVDLSGQSFRGASFHSTDFTDADLRNADFTNAKLHSVDFNGVNLQGACFINASLHSVDFNASNLNGAIFTGSKRYSLDFNYTDTAGVIWDGPTECPRYKGSQIIEPKDSSSRPEVIKAESIKEALIAGPDSKIDLTVNFATDSDEIKEQAHVQVLEIANALKSPELSNQRILIEGHTDNVGMDEYNVDLSYRRAVRVMRVLTEDYDIDAVRLQVKGYGESSPVASNKSDQGRALNRRVTLVNMGNM